MNLDEFVAELETLDPKKLTPRPRALNKARPQPAFGLADFAPVPVEARTGGMTVFADDAPVTPDGQGPGPAASSHPFAVTLAFLTLMLIGGGAAALVFHARIALLLH